MGSEEYREYIGKGNCHFGRRLNWLHCPSPSPLPRLESASIYTYHTARKKCKREREISNVSFLSQIAVGGGGRLDPIMTKGDKRIALFQSSLYEAK